MGALLPWTALHRHGDCHQYEICQDCHDAGLIQYIGKAEDVTADTLQSAVLALTDRDELRRIAERCRLDIG